MHSLLIVDDEPLTREYMKANLPVLCPGWAVSGEADDGAEALAFLENNAVDLVITDIKMPVMDGLALCGKIRELNPRQEIMILSGYDEFSFAQEAMRRGVQGYLLKPIKAEELREALAEADRRIGVQKAQESAYKALTDLSSDYEGHVCRSYLRAVVTDSNTEIKVFHPLVYKLKIDLIQAVSAIMVLRLDVESVLLRKIPLGDIVLFKYVLLQAAREAVEKSRAGYVFPDQQENAVVYITGTSAEETQREIERIYRVVSEFLGSHAGVIVTGGAGAPRSDVLEMRASYLEASERLSQWIAEGGGRLFSGESSGVCASVRIEKIRKACNSVLTAHLDGNEPALHAAAKAYAASMDHPSAPETLRLALLLVDTIKGFLRDFSGEQQERFLRLLADFAAQAADGCEISTALATELFLKIARASGSPAGDESAEQAPQNIVKGAEAFVLDHFAEPISLSQIADALRVSPNYLSRIFHEASGESYIKYLTRIRMEYAAKLLKSGSGERILDVAEKCGYYNLKHFNFVFKEYYSMTPKEYQKKQ